MFHYNYAHGVLGVSSVDTYNEYKIYNMAADCKENAII